MTSKALFCIALSMVFGMAASIGLSQWLESGRKAVGPRQERERIYVAQFAIAAGTPLTQENLRLAPWEVDFLPEGSLRRMEDVLGKVARVPLRPGEALQMTSLATPEEFAAISRPQGAREGDTELSGNEGESRNESVESSEPARHRDTRRQDIVSSPDAAFHPGDPDTEAKPRSNERPATDSVPVVETSPRLPETQFVSTQTAPRVAAETARPTGSPDAEPAGAAEEPVPPLPRPSRTLAAPSNQTHQATRGDDGWVRTLHRSGGSKVLRWRPSSDEPAASSAGQPSSSR